MTEDPWLILNRLAKDGIESVRIDVRLDGQSIVPVTDRALEWALFGELPEKLSAEDEASLRAAIAIVDVDAEQATVIRDEAFGGNEWAERSYHALILRELVRNRILARKLVQKSRQGDEKAIESIRLIRQHALDPSSPFYGRARVCAFLIRDALRCPARPRVSSPPPEPEHPTEPVEAASE